MRFAGDDDGTLLVGVAQTAAVRWLRADGSDLGSGGTCDAAAPSVFMPDPDLL